MRIVHKHGAHSDLLIEYLVPWINSSIGIREPRVEAKTRLSLWWTRKRDKESTTQRERDRERERERKGARGTLTPFVEWPWRPKNNRAGVIPLPMMTERAAESRSLWSIVEVDKITAGLVPAQIKAARGWPARRPTGESSPSCIRLHSNSLKWHRLSRKE
jgi:hypothetical protein